MAREPVDEQIIIDYLLGTLPKDEIERLDELSVSDDDFAEQLDIAEHYLVDAYVRGKLTGDAIDQFKSHYLLSPKHKEKFAFAESFIDLVDKGGTKGSGHMTHKQSGSAFQWALAAALLVMLAAAGFLLREYMAQRGQITQLQQERDVLERREQELQQQVTNQKSAEAESSKELTKVREKLLRTQRQLASQGQTDTQEIEQRDVKIIALNLSAQTRAGKIEFFFLFLR